MFSSSVCKMKWILDLEDAYIIVREVENALVYEFLRAVLAQRPHHQLPPQGASISPRSLHTRLRHSAFLLQILGTSCPASRAEGVQTYHLLYSAQQNSNEK